MSQQLPLHFRCLQRHLEKMFFTSLGRSVLEETALDLEYHLRLRAALKISGTVSSNTELPAPASFATRVYVKFGACVCISPVQSPLAEITGYSCMVSCLSVKGVIYLLIPVRRHCHKLRFRKTKFLFHVKVKVAAVSTLNQMNARNIAPHSIQQQHLKIMK